MTHDTSTAAYRRLHWPNLVARHGFSHPDKAALRWLGQTITWSELDNQVDRAARAFADAGVGKCDRVAILAFNRPEFMYAVLGAMRIGAIGVPINFRLAPAEIAYILTNSEPKVLVVDALLAPGAVAALDQLGEVAPPNVVVTAAEPGAELPAGATEYDAFVDVAAAPPVVDVDENDPALIMYTSGTTGRPKGAVLSHLNLHGNGLTCLLAWRAQTDDVTLVGTPLFHIGGLGVFSGTLPLGGTVVLQPTGLFDPAATLDLMAHESVTGTFLVPAQWQALCAEQARAPRELILRVLSWGAAPASEHLLRTMAATFPQAVSVAVFGQTEMSPITCMLDQQDSIRKLGSVGKPITTLSVRVVDPMGNDVAPGAVGEIVYRGPTQMIGYWRDPARTAEAFAGGWFHSGDLVRQDDEGFVYVVDRAKDMVISGGENIYCIEVENVLADHPDILEVNVIGRPDERWGETPIAIAALHPGASLTIEQLREWADGRIARFKMPTALEIVETLPRNAGGKVVKSQLRQQYSAPQEQS